MQAPAPLLRLLSDDFPTEHPIDPLMKQIVAMCVEEAASLSDATTLINAAFAAASERLDVLQGVMASVIHQMDR